MISTKQQVVFIHGGHSYTSNERFYEALREWEYDPYELERKRWRDKLEAELEERGYEWIFFKMPVKENADYTAWCIWFEKLVPHLNGGVILVGHSLGASFLVTYLTTHPLPIAVSQLHLVAPAISCERNTGLNEFAAKQDALPTLADQVAQIHIYHSSDDQVVPFEDGVELAEKLPKAHFHKFTDRGHFLGEEFPEIHANILSGKHMDTTKANDSAMLCSEKSQHEE